jgi:AraC-like DNA-binding protein
MPEKIRERASGETPRAEFRDIDQFNETVQGWDIDFRQVERGELNAGLSQYPSAVSGLLKVDLSRAIAQRGAPPPGMRTFGIKLDRLAWTDWCRHEVSRDTLLCFHPDSEFECLAPGGFEVYALSLPEPALVAIAERLGHPDLFHDLRTVKTMDVSGFSRFSHLRRLLDCMFSVQHAGPCERLEESLAEELVMLLVEGSVELRPASLRNRSRALKAAMAHILDNAHEAVPVAEVCEASGVSWRTLDRAFKEALGTSPKACINTVRLQGARQALKSAEPTAAVADIANAWGFWHMGDFAMKYRREFAELPSETLNKQHS